MGNDSSPLCFATSPYIHPSKSVNLNIISARNSTTLWHLIGGSRKGRGDRINLLGPKRRFNNCNRWLCATRFKTNKSGAPAAPNTAGIDYSGRSCYWETSAHRRRPMDVGCLSLYLFSANRCAANAVSSSPVSDTSCSRCRSIDMSHQTRKNPRGCSLTKIPVHP